MEEIGALEVAADPAGLDDIDAPARQGADQVGRFGAGDGGQHGLAIGGSALAKDLEDGGLGRGQDA
jgi:hypothetical protein